MEGSKLLELERPIVVGGASSSGTTLLAAVLSRHPRLACGPELSCFDKEELYLLPWSESRRRLGRRAARRMEIADVRWRRKVFDAVEETGITRREVARMAAEADSYRAWLDAFARRFLERTGRSRWVEKTPTNVFCGLRFLELYPEGRFIHMVRDGRDCLVSQMRRGRSLYFSAWVWLCAAAAGHALRGHPRCLTVSYEDLARAPEETLRRICAFLEEAFDPAILVPRESEPGNVHATWQSRPGEPITPRSIGQHLRRLDRETERVFFSFLLTERAVARYGAPFRTVPEALAYWGYDPSRETYPEERLEHVVRKGPSGPLRRLRRWLRGKQSPDEVPQDLIGWCGER